MNLSFLPVQLGITFLFFGVSFLMGFRKGAFLTALIYFTSIFFVTFDKCLLIMFFTFLVLIGIKVVEKFNKATRGKTPIT